MASVNASSMLIVFDFDHTLVDGNTDTWITKLSHDVKETQRTENIGWTDRMSAIFKQLHEKNFRKPDFDKCLETLPFTKGMKELLSFISSQNIHCIIISDSNSYFIDFLLNNGRLRNIFSKIYTNPAYWNDSGVLSISHHHSHSCSRCPENLCKGNVLNAYLKQNAQYKPILYIGDGKGDYCPTLQLCGDDYVFARKEYTLADLLDKQNPPELKANIIHWEDGFDILTRLKTILNSALN